MNELDKDLKKFLNKNGYKLNNDEYDRLKAYFIDNGYIKTFDEVVDENIEIFEISCPRNFLNTEQIVEDDNDYIQIGNKYFNLTLFENDDISDMLDEIMSCNFNITSIANNVIDMAIENQWCDIEVEDVIYILNEDINDIYITILNAIDRMITIDEDGHIKRKRQ